MMPIENLTNLKWGNHQVQTDNFRSHEDFIGYITEKLDFNCLNPIKQWNLDDQKNFSKTFLPFLGEILKLFCKYLPFDDPVLNSLDFLSLRGETEAIENNFLTFNRYFNVIPKEDEGNLIDELVQLTSPESYNYREDDIYKLWERVHKDGYQYASKIALTALSLPTSSAIVEQKFSIMKIIKSKLRNQLSTRALQPLLLIDQEFKEKKELPIVDEMIRELKSIRKELSERKDHAQEIQNKALLDGEKVSTKELDRFSLVESQLVIHLSDGELASFSQRQEKPKQENTNKILVTIPKNKNVENTLKQNLKRKQDEISANTITKELDTSQKTDLKRLKRNKQ